MYEPKPVVFNTAFAGANLGAAGILASAVSNALQTHNRGAWGVLTRTGGTIAFFASLGAAFGFTDAFVANIREKDDYLNGAAGGCAVGLAAGVRARSLPTACISCIAGAVIVGAFDYTGGTLAGDGRNLEPEVLKEVRRQQFFKSKSSFPVPSASPEASS
ncbi:hypothetical protein EXIGLDRAFT_736694 [Exidia glandulosa HHB12029]|uniref:Uncharacterized protein n=1 Tax=Exidia glandulosa HHB12029 TaxID=1314781 RepID=A0A165PBP9_EXIGL|nr:hypothetical protein EXIGLDRAFT_736694 [Exidia glandulosa HHB12029]